MSDSFTATSGIWDDAANWSAGIPVSSTSVTIGSTVSLITVTGAADAAASIGATGAASGGADNTFDIAGTLAVGALSSFASFDVVIEAGDLFSSAQLALTDSSMDVYGTESILNGGGATINSSTLVVEAGGTMDVSQFVSNGQGQLIVDGTLDVTGGGPGSGAGTVGNGGLVTVDGSEGSGTTWYLEGGTFTSTQQYQNGIFDFTGTAGGLLDLPDDALYNTSISVAGFTAGDTIILGPTSNTDAVTASLSGGVLSLTQDGSLVEQLATFALASGDSADHLQASVIDGQYVVTYLCFYPGTRLATPDGEIEVQDVVEGTMLKTAGGKCLPVRWVGWREVSTRFGDRLRSLPIRIRAGALADGVPSRDLLVSPDHAIFMDGVLAHAGALVNGASITRETAVPEIFRYYHVELATHELLLAENCPAESFVDNVDRMNFQNWAQRAASAAPVAEMPFPRAKAARQVPGGLRASLAARAALFAEPRVA